MRDGATFEVGPLEDIHGVVAGQQPDEPDIYDAVREYRDAHPEVMAAPVQQPVAYCCFPDCKCPMDPGPEPDWCARGLSHATPSAALAQPANLVDDDGVPRTALVRAARLVISGSTHQKDCNGGYWVPADLWLALQAEVMEELRKEAQDYFKAAPAQPDPMTKGWLAALSDARYAARGNDWLTGKLAEIHVHLAAPAQPAQQPEGEQP